MRALTVLLSGVVTAALSVGALAADYTFTISSWAPPTHGINAQMWPKFIKMMEDATDGKVTAQIKYRLGPPPAQMDLVQDGAADFSWIFHGYQAGRFTATKLIELPGYEGSSEAAAVAYWRVHEKHLAATNEHRGVKLVGLMVHGPAQLHSSAKVTSLDQIKGLKLRVPGGVGGDAGTALGATGIKVPAPKVYETLASNAADGVVMPMEARKGFKLTEVAKNVYEMPGGLYRGSFALIMNREAFDELPADLRKALEDKVFGEPVSRMAGKVWDAIDDDGRAATKGASDNTINAASAADVAAYGAIAGQLRTKVLADLAAKGIDANVAYTMVKAEMARN